MLIFALSCYNNQYARHAHAGAGFFFLHLGSTVEDSTCALLGIPKFYSTSTRCRLRAGGPVRQCATRAHIVCDANEVHAAEYPVRCEPSVCLPGGVFCFWGSP